MSFPWQKNEITVPMLTAYNCLVTSHTISVMIQGIANAASCAWWALPLKYLKRKRLVSSSQGCKTRFTRCEMEIPLPTNTIPTIVTKMRHPIDSWAIPMAKNRCVNKPTKEPKNKTTNIFPIIFGNSQLPEIRPFTIIWQAPSKIRTTVKGRDNHTEIGRAHV